MEKENSLVITITDFVGIQSSKVAVANDNPCLQFFVSYSGSVARRVQIELAIVTVVTVAMCVVRYSGVTKTGLLSNTKL